MAEKEYIERDATLAYMSEVKAACISNFEYEASAVIGGMICEIKDGEIPAAEVAPVKRGRWVWESNYRDYDGDICSTYSCSNCEKMTSDESPYCPCCGAKMDGDTK